MSVFLSLLAKTGMSLLMSLASEMALKELFFWMAEKLVASTKTTYDDELLDILKKYDEKKS